MIFKKKMYLNLIQLKAFFVFNLITQLVFSGSQGNINNGPLNSFHPLITVSIGPDFVRAGKAQTLTLVPPFQNYYTSNNRLQTVVDAGGFIGVEHPVNSRFFAQFGMSAYYDSNLNPRGHVWQFALPLFDNLKYTYRIQHARVMATGKILSSFSNFSSLHPYFSWEVGAAFNRTSHYVETSLIPTVVPAAPFANNNQSSFAYGVGVGLDYSMSEHTRMGIGYQFADLGSASLGKTVDAFTNQTLSISHLYTNQLRFQFTYLI